MHTLKVFLSPGPGLGHAIHRTAWALRDYAPPWVQVVPDRAQADFQVIHALGDGERRPILDGLAAGTQLPYAMIQYCLRTTESPRTQDWLEVWAGARLVWSYYDLQQLMIDDGIDYARTRVRHYYAPLGVDPAFTLRPVPRALLVGTSGYVAATEGIAEWGEVIRRTDQFGFHLGPVLPELVPPGRWLCRQGISDRQVATFWSQCRYVAAMRRIEGFELPGVEGLACGARPVCFRQPHYSHWYLDHAEYIDEGPEDQVVDELLALVRGAYRAVTPAEMAWAKTTFDWKTLVGGFWERVEGVVR